jgi:2-polyprenyl-3-methyl-5-hydroxy-6-metoxy-1,4-benzoquinol methylase
VRQGARICEIGSGNSRMLHELAALGYDVVGTEMNPAIIERVRRLTCVPVLCGGTELFRDSEFDAVLSLDVLEHFHDPLEALREYARILKPSGVLLLHTTVHEKPEDPFRYPVAMIWKSYHLYLFSRSTLWQLISRACFEVLRAERQVFGWPVLLLRKASG